MTRHRKNDISKTLKDYAVPLIGLFLILILLYSVFNGEDNINNIKETGNIESLNFDEVKVSLGTSDAKAYIVYESGKKVEIQDNISLQKSEKITVESGNVDIEFPFFAKMKLKEKGEIIYKEDGSIFLESGNLWLEALDNINIFMKFAEVSIPSGAIVNLSQNQLESVIYNIDGNILVSNLAGNAVKLKSLEKIIIKSKDASSTDINLDSEKTEIDDYFKLSSWFKENNGDNLIKDNNSLTGTTLTGTLLNNKSKIKDLGDLISFDNISDETYVDKNPIDLVGRFSPLKVGKITINNNEVKLDEEMGNFSLKGFSLNYKINDLVIKLFDKEGNIISKNIITLYTNKVSNNNANIVINKPLENYPVRATDFIIYEPSRTGKFTTKSGQVTIRGKVKNPDVKSVLVNDYKLKSYNGSTWRYHAFIEQGTLKDGANNYEIKYLDKDGKVIYKEYFSIYKEIKEPVVKTVQKISGEAKIN